jgi:hypothetical protein
MANDTAPSIMGLISRSEGMWTRRFFSMIDLRDI